MVELKGFKDLRKHLQLNVFSSPGGCEPKITPRFFLQKAICQKWDGPASHSMWRCRQHRIPVCAMWLNITYWTRRISRVWFATEKRFVCSYLSLSTFLKPGRMCLKLELRSSFGWLLVLLMEPFSRRLRKPWTEHSTNLLWLTLVSETQHHVT